MRRFGILVVLALGGCATRPQDPSLDLAAPRRPVLPALPADFGRPVRGPTPRAGQDVRVYAGQERAARLADERRLADDLAFGRDLETRFGAGEDGR